MFGGGLAFYSGSDIVAAGSRSAAIVLRERKTPARKAGVKSRCMSVTRLFRPSAQAKSTKQSNGARGNPHKKPPPASMGLTGGPKVELWATRGSKSGSGRQYQLPSARVVAVGTLNTARCVAPLFV